MTAKQLDNDLPIRDLMTLQDMLLLVDVRLPLIDLRCWTKAECEIAEKWAAALHLRASDNNVKVPPKPSFIK